MPLVEERASVSLRKMKQEDVRRKQRGDKEEEEEKKDAGKEREAKTYVCDDFSKTTAVVREER